MRYITIVLLTVFVLSACATETEPAREIKLTVLPNPTSDSTATPFPTHTVTPLPTGFTPLPQPTSTSFAQSVRNTSSCSLRTDLPTYQVTIGDSLLSIATRHNTTVEQLAEFNCLNNANLIQVGMTLYVPLPLIPTHTPPVSPDTVPLTSTPTLLGVIGTLGASPVIEAGNPADWTDYVIEAQVPITINWTGIEPDIYNQVSETTFFYTPDGGTPQMIGVDSSLAGGMSITWTPPSGVSGTITASARTINNAFIDSSRLHIREAQSDASQSQ